MLEDLTKPTKPHNTCQVIALADTLEPADREILLKAAEDKAWPASALAIALRNKGLALTEKRIYDHRKGQCYCSKN